MAVVGRCAGCGATFTSPKTATSHIIGCEAFAALYRTDRARALDPKAEQARFVAVEGTIEQQTADRLDAMATRFLHDDSVKAEHVSRWATPPDPLDEP